MHKMLSACTILISLVAVGVEASDTPFFMGLGHLEGYPDARAFALSGDGRVVAGTAENWPEEEFMGFRWTLEEGMVALGDLPGGEIYSSAYGVSYDGSVIVGNSKSNQTSGYGYEAFKWTEASGMVGLGDLPGGEFRSRATGVSADGTVIVGVANQGDHWDDYSEAVRWVQGQQIEALTPCDDDMRAWANAVSADGSVVVGTNDFNAMRWTEESGAMSLGHLAEGSYTDSHANAVSADGSVVVGEFDITSDATEAFIWTPEDGMMSLGELAGGLHRSIAYDVSGDGSIVVGSSHLDSTRHPIIWDREHGMRDLYVLFVEEYGFDLSDWRYISDAVGISDDGMTIIGRGSRNGVTEPWIAHIPEPPTVMMLLPALCVIAVLRK